MALKYAPRIKESTTTTGTGIYTLSGTLTGYRTFLDGLGDYDINTFYVCTDGGANWEFGVGTLQNDSGPKLARTSVFASSNSNEAVDWAAGVKEIACEFPYRLLEALQGGYHGAFETGAGNVIEASQTLGLGRNLSISGGGGQVVIVGDSIDILDVGNVYALGQDLRARRGAGLLLSTGKAASNGDTQTTLAVRNVTTTDATTTGVTDSVLDSFSGYDATIAYVVDVVARQVGGVSGTVGDSKWIRLEFLIKYATTPTLTLIGSVTTTTLAASAGASAWTATVDVAEANAIRVTGEVDKDILWMVTLRGLELGYVAP